MKIYKLEVLIIDEDVVDMEDAENIISETRYPNHTNVVPVTCREVEIGEFDENGPLNSNYNNETIKEMNRLFPNKNEGLVNKSKIDSLKLFCALLNNDDCFDWHGDINQFIEKYKNIIIN